MSMYHFSDTEAVEHDVNTVPDSGDFERVEIDGQWYVPERTCRMGAPIDGEYRCSECGHLNRETYKADRGWYRPKYCSYCGSKVVDE